MDKPQLQKAIEYLKNELQKRSNGPLPSVRMVARNCSVSTKTAYKAIKMLIRDGLLYSRWGYGTISAKNDFLLENRNITDNKLPVFKTEHVTNELENDLINSTYSQGDKLPSAKILINRYNTSYPTIKKALHCLINKNLILKKGHSYFIAERKRLYKSKVSVICAMNNNGEIVIEKERERDFYRLLSMEADRRNLQLEFIGYSDWCAFPFFSNQHNMKAVNLTEDADIIGYILVSWHMKDYLQCLNTICYLKKPVSVWLENFHGIPDKKDAPGKVPLLFFDQSYSRQSGNDMGRFLLGAGHRKIAYISPFHGSSWSQKRLSGLKEVFYDTGIKEGVVEFTDSKFTSDWSFMDVVLQNNEIETFLNTSQFKNRLGNLRPERINQTLFEINGLIRDNHIYKESIELFKGALSDQSVSAWVAANDLCAFLCLNFLKQSSVIVPDKISIAGFDNTFQSLKLGITSYDFNTQGLVQSMIDHLINPSSNLYQKDDRILYLSGKVIERGSVKLIKSKG